MKTDNTKRSGLTILVPAYNEEGMIADTVESLKSQTFPPDEIIVIDDCSTDRTYEFACQTGATVVRPPKNTGSKAGAQNYALQFVKTEFTMAVDADTTLERHATERIMKALDDETVAAACGFVLPRRTKTIWERGRYIEYMFAFTFYKPIQDFYQKPMISSGCFSVYRTAILKQYNGWSVRTMAEDMDLTWSLYHANHGIRFVPEAVSYPVEPDSYHFMSKQLRRWSHGFIQNVCVHWKDLLKHPCLSSIIAVALWDSIVASLCYLLLVPILAIFVHPLFLLTYLIDAPALAVPVLWKGVQRKEVGKVLMSLPSFFILRIVNSVFILKAIWLEVILKKRLMVYEKGH